MTIYSAVIWPISGGVQTLETLPGGTSAVYDISHDGTVLVGSALDALNIRYPARWDNAALTLLPSITGVTAAVRCSQDASIIIGAGDQYGSSPAAMWTNGVAVTLPPLPGDSETFITAYAGVSSRVCSDDGTIIFGTSYPSRNGLKWLAGSPSALTGVTNGIIDSSEDGSLAVASSGFWRSGVFYPLQLGTNQYIYPHGCNGEGTIIFGTAVFLGTYNYVYWDNLTTAASGQYGVMNYMDDAGSSSTSFCSMSGMVLGATGGISGHNRAMKYVGTTATVLPLLSGYTDSVAQWVSADGSIIGGNISNMSVYWDSTNVVHTLPLPGPGSSSTSGISRDGSTIYGYAHFSPSVSSSPAQIFHMA